MRHAVNFFTSILLIALCIKCTNNVEEKNKISEIKEDNPAEIINHGLVKQFNQAKWFLYCIHCDEVCAFNKRTGIADVKTFGELPLKFEGVNNYHDTAEIAVSFFYQQFKCDNLLLDNESITYGAAFKDGSDSIIYFLKAPGRYWSTVKSSRYANPLQPEVIRYIQQNKHKINPWFRKEAEKKGII